MLKVITVIISIVVFIVLAVIVKIAANYNIIGQNLMFFIEALLLLFIMLTILGIDVNKVNNFLKK